MNNFTILKGQTIYKQGVSKGEGYWKDGVYYQGEDTPIYEPLSNVFVEPYEREDSDILPEGISTNDARWILCDHVLSSYRENADNASMADRIFLRDPEVGKKATPYIIFDIETWGGDEGMELLSDGFNYVAVKEGKF
jgi:hypothetical protein